VTDGYESTAAISPSPAGKASNRGVIIAVVIAVVILLIVGAAGMFMVNEARQEAAAAREDADAALAALETEREATDASSAAAEAEAEAAASDAAAAAAREEAAEATQAAADDRERRDRALAVGGIEDSITELAEDHVADGFIDGPVLHVTCSPVAGGSFDNLTEVTTSFECFVANKELDDGRAQGVTYNATMNWDSDQYTYGLGAP
jgi:hypothetical protein